MALHQVIGERAIEFATANKGQYEADVVASMAYCFRLLLPFTPVEAVELVLKGMVSRAIELKTDMVTEKTFFRFIWYDAGMDLDVKTVDVRDPPGHNLICAFPGIKGVRSLWGRSIWADKQNVTLVKAKVEALRK
jgi:hypothetical protein